MDGGGVLDENDLRVLEETADLGVVPVSMDLVGDGADGDDELQV